MERHSNPQSFGNNQFNKSDPSSLWMRSEELKQSSSASLQLNSSKNSRLSDTSSQGKPITTLKKNSSTVSSKQNSNSNVKSTMLSIHWNTNLT